MKNSEKIQMVINTLEILDMKPTYDNTNRMLGIYQTLLAVRDDLKTKEAEEDAGEADAE